MSQNISSQVSSHFPDSSLGSLAAKIVEIINGRDEVARIEFLNSNLSEMGLTRISVEKYSSLLNRVHSQTGGVKVAGVRPLNNLIEVQLKSNKAEHWARLYIFLDKAQPEKILEFGFMPITDPTDGYENPWTSSNKSNQGSAREIQKHVERLANKDAFSGVVLLAQNDVILYNEAFGLAERSFKIPNLPDTKFNLGSMNKMFTAVATAQLVESGSLSFSTRLEEVMPDYPNKTASSKITIQHLLSHTAGLGAFFDSSSYNPRKKYKDHTELASVFANNPLLFEPGTRSSYSNEGFIVIGAVIERVSGENYWDFVRDHIFRPAGMHDTDSYALDEAVPNLAVGYMRNEDDPFGMEPRMPNFMFLGSRGNSCGGGYSTAFDLLRFSRALRGYKLLNKELTETITTKPGLMPGYGYGFEVQSINGNSIRGHSGGGANSGVNSDFGVFWEKDYTLVVLSNYDAPVAQDLHQKICEFIANTE